MAGRHIDLPPRSGALEVTYGSFKRQFRLPENLDGEPVAELKDGILKLTFKRQLPEEKQPESRKIPIQKG